MPRQGICRYTLLILPLLVLAACQDGTMPLDPEVPQLAKQPLKGVWTVTSLEDPGAGCSADECTLRQAIAAAAPGDRIVFKSNLSGSIALAAQQLLIDKDLTIEGPGLSRIAIDGQGTTRVLRISEAVKVTLSGLTMTGGNGEGEGNGGLGGGILIASGATLAMTNCAVVGNSARNGGAIFNDGRLTLVGCDVSDNTADNGVAGGLYNAGTATLTNTTVSGNTASLQGGGIYNSGTLALVNSTVSGNAALRGGGVYQTGSGTATVVRSTLSGNSAGEEGGGIYGGDVFLASSTVAANHAEEFGGGVVAGPALWLQNTILIGNTGPTYFNCQPSPVIISLGHNVTDADCGNNGTTDVGVPASLVFTIVLDPTLTDNGGPTKTHALIERGLAVDAGYCPGETTDQRGFPRPFDDLRMPNALDGCDIGAFEWQATPSGKGKK